MADILDESGAYILLDESGGDILDEAGAPAPGPTVDPAWLAARTGLPGYFPAVNNAAQIGQFLAAHAITPLYAGNQIAAPSGSVGFGYGGIDWINLGVYDVDQPFTMVGSVLGRVTLPLLAAGSGADVTVGLYTTAGGFPSTLICSTRIPASWIAQLAAPSGLPGGPLATAWSNTLRMDEVASVAWSSPVCSLGSPMLPTTTSSGSYILQAGGQDGGSVAANSFTVGWSGGTSIGTVLPQPAVPQATGTGTLIATPDTLILAGGQPTLSTVTADVWAASWSPPAGAWGAWSAQTALPQALSGAAGANSGDTVYVIGGAPATGIPVTNVYYATVSNGQVTGWTAGPPLPAARSGMFAGVAGGWLIAGGGGDLSGYYANVWCAPVRADGSLGSWQPGPSLPAATFTEAGCSCAVTSSGLVLFSGFGNSGTLNLIQTLTVTADGPGQWQQQTLNPAINSSGGNNPTAAYSLGPGTWQLISIEVGSGSYCTGVLASVPAVSVPLPATGLTSGGTYHIVVHQVGGDLNDYTMIAADPGALPDGASTRPNAGGTWTALPGGYSLIAGLWDQTPGGPVLHTWEDSGARITTLVYGGQYGQLMGVLEAAAFEDGTLLPVVTEVAYNAAGLPIGLVQLA